MSYNYRLASDKTYPLRVKGKLLSLNQSQIAEVIKNRMRKDPAVLKMFEEFEIDIKHLDDLEIEIKPLNDRFAETDLKSMVLTPQLFEKQDFWKDSYYIAIHEMVHFCSRFAEKQGTFRDPEEVAGFVFSIVSLLVQKCSVEEIYNKIFPKIEFHFHNAEDAQKFFFRLLEKAKKILL